MDHRRQDRPHPNQRKGQQGMAGPRLRQAQAKVEAFKARGKANRLGRKSYAAVTAGHDALPPYIPVASSTPRETKNAHILESLVPLLTTLIAVIQGQN